MTIASCVECPAPDAEDKSQPHTGAAWCLVFGAAPAEALGEAAEGPAEGTDAEERTRLAQVKEGFQMSVLCRLSASVLKRWPLL